jgi:hypothetical protein
MDRGIKHYKPAAGGRGFKIGPRLKTRTTFGVGRRTASFPARKIRRPPGPSLIKALLSSGRNVLHVVDAVAFEPMTPFIPVRLSRG